MRVRHLQRLTIRTALVLGFGLTLGVWLLAGWYFTNRIAAIQRDAEVVNARYMQAQELLTSVRSQILLGSLSVRDAMLDPDPVGTRRSSALVSEMFLTVDRSLQHYVPILDSRTEHVRVQRLRTAIVDLGQRLQAVLDENAMSTAEARLLLNSQVVPQRDLVIRVSDEAQALNRAAFVRQQNDVAAIYQSTQRRLWTQLGLALGVSLAIALMATIYAGRLETRLREQGEREVQHADDLQRLSAKLISAQEEERRGIARELHDELGQGLSAIKVDIALARRAVESTGSAGHLLDDAEAIANTALTTVRDMSRLLPPSMLDDLGLPAAVDSYLRGFGARYGIRAELLSDRMEQRLQPETEVTAYRIIQEALTNVARHAHATTCRVYLQRLTTTILVTIEDNGTGFDTGRAQQPDARRGLGLLGIRERASLLRGTLRLESTPGTGTRLTVELPAAPRLRAAEDTDGADNTDNTDVIDANLLAAPRTVNG
jgi:signal transduction histidine kinase